MLALAPLPGPKECELSGVLAKPSNSNALITNQSLPTSRDVDRMDLASAGSLGRWAASPNARGERYRQGHDGCEGREGCDGSDKPQWVSALSRRRGTARVLHRCMPAPSYSSVYSRAALVPKAETFTKWCHVTYSNVLPRATGRAGSTGLIYQHEPFYYDERNSNGR